MSASGTDWVKLFSLYVALHLIRGAVVILSWPILKQGYGISYKEGIVLIFGGLRGAIGLSLALVMEEIDEVQSMDKVDTIVFHMAGIALLTLIVNGTCMRPMIHALGYEGGGAGGTEGLCRARVSLKDGTQECESGVKKVWSRHWSLAHPLDAARFAVPAARKIDWTG